MPLLTANSTLLPFVGGYLLNILFLMATIMVVNFEITEGLRKRIVWLRLLEKRRFSAHFQLTCSVTL